MTDTCPGNEMPPPPDTCHFDDSVRFITALSTAIDQYGGHTHDTDNTIRQIINARGHSPGVYDLFTTNTVSHLVTQISELLF